VEIAIVAADQVGSKGKKTENRKESSHKDRNADVKFMPRVQRLKFIVSIGVHRIQRCFYH